MQMLSFSNNFSYQLHDILLLPSLGGSVKGGEILGKYPEDITDEGPLTLGRGGSTRIYIMPIISDYNLN